MKRISMRRRLKPSCGSDCRVALIPGPRQVQRIFEITGIEERLEFVADADGLARQPAATNDVCL